MSVPTGLRAEGGVEQDPFLAWWIGSDFFCTGNHGFVHEISVYIAVSYRCPWNNLQPIQNLKSCKTLVVCHSLVGGIICTFLWSPRGWFSDFYSWRAPHTSLFFDLWGNHCYKFPTVVLVGFQSLGLGYRKWIMDARHSKPEWSPGILEAVALCSPCCRVISHGLKPWSYHLSLLLAGSLFVHVSWWISFQSMNDLMFGWSNPPVCLAKSPLLMVKSDKIVRILICLASTNFSSYCCGSISITSKNDTSKFEKISCVCPSPCLRNSIRPILLVTKKFKSTSHHIYVVNYNDI